MIIDTKWMKTKEFNELNELMNSKSYEKSKNCWKKLAYTKKSLALNIQHLSVVSQKNRIHKMSVEKILTADVFQQSSVVCCKLKKYSRIHSNMIQILCTMIVHAVVAKVSSGIQWNTVCLLRMYFHVHEDQEQVVN